MQRRRQFMMTFSSTHQAIQVEKLVNEAGIKGRIVGIPNQISAGCGLALLADYNDALNIGHLIEVNNLQNDVHVYMIEYDGLEKRYEPFNLLEIRE